MERSSSHERTASPGAPRAQPDRAEGGERVAVDRLQHALAVLAQELLGARPADVPNASQVRLQRGLARGPDRLGARDLHLRAEALVVLPRALHPHALADLEVGERPDEHHQLPVVVGVEHREPGLGVREALDADQHLGRERVSHGADHILRWCPRPRPTSALAWAS